MEDCYQPNPAMEQLFDRVTKATAHPHTTITEHDKERAARVFLIFDSYLKEMIMGFEDEDCPSLLFGDHAQYVLEELK
jgi:hypothetical protein